ncbi:CinA family protein [Pseudopelagicola sp. nBUS_19]|uniref:CinA family protein n=1 Tax=Pseudopelagicola sp. nBUS_19 TaxID=3395316 RepID=UPI003EB9ACFB
MKLALNILSTCQLLGLKVATAESCTGGMVAAALTDIPGSSAVFERGFITYTNTAKIEMLGVNSTTLEKVGATSEEVAWEMAMGALEYSNADIAVSLTGIAGPGGSRFKPEGRVCFGLARGQVCVTKTVEFGSIGRDNVRQAARNHALLLILRAASEN